MLRHSLRLSLLASALLLLPACGGGGGGGAAASNEEPEQITLTELLPAGYSHAEFQCSYSLAKTNSLYFHITKGDNQYGGNVNEVKVTFHSGTSAAEVWQLEDGEGSWEVLVETGFLGLRIKDITSLTTRGVSLPKETAIQMIVKNVIKDGLTIKCSGTLRIPTSVWVKNENTSKAMKLDGAEFAYTIYP